MIGNNGKEWELAPNTIKRERPANKSKWVPFIDLNKLKIPNLVSLERMIEWFAGRKMLRIIFVSYQRRFKSLLSHTIRYKSHFTFFLRQSTVRLHSQRRSIISHAKQIKTKLYRNRAKCTGIVIVVYPVFKINYLESRFCSFFAYTIFIDENYMFGCHWNE